MNMQALIDDYLARESAKPRDRSNKIHPSSLGQCLRRQIFTRLGTEKTNPPDKRTLRVFQVGHMYHKFIYTILENMEAECKIEVEVETDDIHGFADIVNKDTVYDIKSVHSRKFWYMKPKDITYGDAGEFTRKETYEEFLERITEDIQDNVLQVMLYCMLLEKPFGKLVYISKDDMCIQDYTFEVDKWRDKVNDELIVLRAWWDKHSLPPAIPRLYKNEKTGKFKECEYCNWKDLCKSMPQGATELSCRTSTIS